MTVPAAYERLIAEGRIHSRHELTVMRYAACLRAAKRYGTLLCGPDHPDFLASQYGFVRYYFHHHICALLELLTRPEDQEWTLDMLAEAHGLDAAGIDEALDAAGSFLTGDCSAAQLEHQARYDGWFQDGNTMPAFLRRKPVRA